MDGVGRRKVVQPITQVCDQHTKNAVIYCGAPQKKEAILQQITDNYWLMCCSICVRNLQIATENISASKPNYTELF